MPYLILPHLNTSYFVLHENFTHNMPISLGGEGEQWEGGRIYKRLKQEKEMKQTIKSLLISSYFRIIL